MASVDRGGWVDSMEDVSITGGGVGVSVAVTITVTIEGGTVVEMTGNMVTGCGVTVVRTMPPGS
jgi:hypothetical protein